jgi:predicted acyl esterase
VGGWQDPYTNTAFRMLENLKCPKKAVVGPWGHKYPNFAKPGPQIGFLQETVRWWDKWLKGIDETGIMEEPQLRCYLQDPFSPAAHDKVRPGHWVAETKWNDEKALTRRMGLALGRLTEETTSGSEKVDICSPQTLGFAGGRWLIFGVEGEGPSDQRLEAGGSLVFDTAPLKESLDMLGAAVLNVRIASDKPDALLAATLSEVLPNGAATRISYGLLNLTHRDSHEDLEKLEPGKFYDIKLKLNHFGQRLGVGSRLRLALSSTYFPIVWPSPEVTTLTIDTGASSIDLPVRIDDSHDSELKPFRPAVNGTLKKTQLRPAVHKNYVKQDWDTGRTELVVDWDDGKWEIDATGWRFGWTTPLTMGVHPSDPLSAEVYQGFEREFERGDIKASFKGWTKMTATATEWIMTARVDAWEGEKAVFGRDYEFKVPRDHV